MLTRCLLRVCQVDLDIKLRSCKGSCSGYSEHQVDKEGYVELDKQVRADLGNVACVSPEKFRFSSSEKIEGRKVIRNNSGLNLLS